MQNNIPYNYQELRKVINHILNEFFGYEYKLYKHGEFDYEYMEATTDDILRLIQQQGGTYGDG